MTTAPTIPPDQLEGDRHVARVQGDALQLACFTRDHGPETLHRLLDAWGPDHLRNVTIALAAAVNIDRTPEDLWGWLGDTPRWPLSVTIHEAKLWATHDPAAPKDTRRNVDYSPEARQRMAERARTAGLISAAKRRNRQAA
jgi:hypothetical protein